MEEEEEEGCFLFDLLGKDIWPGLDFGTLFWTGLIFWDTRADDVDDDDDAEEIGIGFDDVDEDSGVCAEVFFLESELFGSSYFSLLGDFLLSGCKSFKDPEEEDGDDGESLVDDEEEAAAADDDSADDG